MILTFIFLGLTIIFGLLSYTSKEEAFSLGVLTFLCGFFSVCCITGLTTASHKYDEFMLERDSFEQTIKTFKISPNENTLEVTSLTKDVIKWNYKLAILKRDNNKWFLKDFVDDRFDKVQPIK
jgi:hypothetical protein